MKIQVLKKIKQQGNRLTKPRKLIIEIFTKVRYPLTAQEIQTFLKKESINIDFTSIYRTISLLISVGLIDEINWGDGKKRYEIIRRKKHHHHLVCDNCGAVENIVFKDEQWLIDKIKRKTKFQIKRHSLEFFGLCQNCR